MGERRLSARDLAAETAPCRENKPSKAHTIRTVMYVWTHRLRPIPPPASFLPLTRTATPEGAVSPLFLFLTTDAYLLTVNSRVYSILFHTFHPASNLLPAPRKSAGLAFYEGRSLDFGDLCT